MTTQPSDVGCGWRLIELPSRHERLIATTPGCPEDIAVASSGALLGRQGVAVWRIADGAVTELGSPASNEDGAIYALGVLGEEVLLAVMSPAMDPGQDPARWILNGVVVEANRGEDAVLSFVLDDGFARLPQSGEDATLIVPFGSLFLAQIYAYHPEQGWTLQGLAPTRWEAGDSPGLAALGAAWPKTQLRPSLSSSLDPSRCGAGAAALRCEPCVGCNEQTALATGWGQLRARLTEGDTLHLQPPLTLCDGDGASCEPIPLDLTQVSARPSPNGAWLLLGDEHTGAAPILLSAEGSTPLPGDITASMWLPADWR